MMRDPAAVINDADARARAAHAILDHPGLTQAFAHLSELYTLQWRASDLTTPEGENARQTAFWMLRALDLIVEDLQASLIGAAVVRHNVGPALRRQGGNN